MLTLKFYAGADDAPARLPVRVFAGVMDVTLTDDDPPRLSFVRSPGSVSFLGGRNEVEYLPLNGAVVEVFDNGVSIAVLNAGPEVLTIPDNLVMPLSTFTFDAEAARRIGERMREGGRPGYRMTGEEARRTAERMQVENILEVDLIGFLGGPVNLAAALRAEGYHFIAQADRVSWDGPEADGGKMHSQQFPGATEAVLDAEAHMREQARKGPGLAGAAVRTAVMTVLDRARALDGLPPLGSITGVRVDLPSLSEYDRMQRGDEPDLIALALEMGGATVITPTGSVTVDPATYGLSQQMLDAGYTVERSEAASCAWRWRRGEARSDWFNGDDSRDRCIAELERELNAPRCACGEPVGQPHRSDCGQAAFLGDTVRSEHAPAPVKARIFPPVPDEDWLPVDQYPASWTTRTDRIVVMIRDDEGNVARAYGADGTWWLDNGPGATPYQTDFEPTHFSYLPAPHRFACRTCWAWLGTPHVEGCPVVHGPGSAEVLMGDTPPAEATGRILRGDMLELTLAVLDNYAAGTGPLTPADARKAAAVIRATEPAMPDFGDNVIVKWFEAQGGDRLLTQFRRAGDWPSVPDTELRSIVEAFDAGKTAATEAIIRHVLHGHPRPTDAPIASAPAATAPYEVLAANPRNAAWFEGAMKWAENLIVQLPAGHDGRNSWLLNHGLTAEAVDIQDRRAAYDPGFAAQLAGRRGPPPFHPGDDQDGHAARALHAQAEEPDAIDQLIDGIAGAFAPLPPIMKPLELDGTWTRHNPLDFGGLCPDAAEGHIVQVAGEDCIESAPRPASEVYWGAGSDCDNPVRYWRLAPLVAITVDNQTIMVAAGSYTGASLLVAIGQGGKRLGLDFDLLRHATKAERDAGARGRANVKADDSLTITGGEAFDLDLPF